MLIVDAHTHVVASDRAEWRLPQVSLGILPAYGGGVRLARWVGRGNAMRLVMGFPLGADEAHRIGLAQWVVPHGELMVKALEVARPGRGNEGDGHGSRDSTGPV